MHLAKTQLIQSPLSTSPPLPSLDDVEDGLAGVLVSEAGAANVDVLFRFVVGHQVVGIGHHAAGGLNTRGPGRETSSG